MGKTTDIFKILLNVSLKGSPKGVFPTEKFEIKIFILKFARNTFHPKINKLHIRVKNDVWAPKCEKLMKKALFVIKKRNFAIGTLYRLFFVYGELSRHFYPLKGFVSFSGDICVSFTRMKVEFA